MNTRKMLWDTVRALTWPPLETGVPVAHAVIPASTDTERSQQISLRNAEGLRRWHALTDTSIVLPLRFER